jgi:hypothetical protein
MEWDLVNGGAQDDDWAQPAPAAAPQPAADDENAEAEPARRNRLTEDQRRRSAMLSFLLRHAPNKYPDLKAKQRKGGFFPVDGTRARENGPERSAFFSFSTFSDRVFLLTASSQCVYRHFKDVTKDHYRPVARNSDCIDELSRHNPI